MDFSFPDNPHDKETLAMEKDLDDSVFGAVSVGRTNARTSQESIQVPSISTRNAPKYEMPTADPIELTPAMSEEGLKNSNLEGPAKAANRQEARRDVTWMSEMMGKDLYYGTSGNNVADLDDR